MMAAMLLLFLLLFQYSQSVNQEETEAADESLVSRCIRLRDLFEMFRKIS